ncbi:MAG: hypothetical protein GC146_13220 [Limimaricola sp.]|uniref:YIP1 family protein n=1 Tax=Limimaricola sp. TaxID=2211665 RepID=UPI001DB377C2|nr:YIP1 family protein [Limimaricola sp.]MBI1418176.1 hypothetical protein [Limimaricola sp.]
MAVTADIVRSWRTPRAVMRDLLAMGRREDRAIAYVMFACGLVFVAQIPRLLRISAAGQGATDGSADFDMLMGTTLFVWLFLMPLVFYGIAALSHLIARLFGGKGSWFGARLALFWALLSCAPLLLVQGLAVGLAGPQAVVTQVVGAAWLVLFLVIWGMSLREAEAPVDAG